MCQLLVEKSATQQHAAQLKRQVAEISSHLLNTFEEITLLHRLTEHLSLSKSVVKLCELSVRWLSDVIPAKCVAIKLNSVVDVHDRHAMGDDAEQRPDADQSRRLSARRRRVRPLHGAARARTWPPSRWCSIASATSSPTWFYPDVRELISVPIREGDRLFGWLLALNHTGAGDVTNSEVEFGTVEASLLASVATILGIHGGNITLYQEQADFFASVVRALTSAIDAKDPYTCGHSDRVARLSVCLARRLGCSDDELDTIYLSGLLHDIGKIGIDDNVLRKPGALTEAELEHIKTHPRAGLQDSRRREAARQGAARRAASPRSLGRRRLSRRPQGRGMPEAGPDRGGGRLDRRDVERPAVPQRHSRREARRDPARRSRPAMGCRRSIDAAFQVRDEIRKIGGSEREPLDRWTSAQWRVESTHGACTR